MGIAGNLAVKNAKKQSKSIRTVAFFSKSKLELKTIVYLIYEWSIETPVHEVVSEHSLSKKTIIDWFKFCREICLDYFLILSERKEIGGVDKIVEIDETVVTRRKYMVGRLVKTVWLVGGIVRGDQCDAFLEIVENRSSNLLIDVICRNVERGSTIFTGLWRRDNGLSANGFNYFCKP